MRARRRGGRAALGLAVAAVLAAPAAPTAASAATGPPETIARLGAAIDVATGAAGHVALVAIDCANEHGCVAVGSDAAGRAVVTSGTEAAGRWRWSAAAVLPAGPGGTDRLSGVSCPTPSACVAVGTDGSGQGEATLGVQRRGRWRWTRPVAVAPDGTGGGALAAVSCPTAAGCVAVGSDAAAQGIATTGVRTRSGWSWSAAVPIAPDASGSGGLTSVSCADATACVAVGTDAASAGIVTAGVGHAGGWAWSEAASLGAAPDALVGVSCASPTRCVAVGNGTGGHVEAAAGTRVGATWSWQPAGVIAQLATVAGLSCRTAALCVAVGTAAAAHGTVNGYALAHLAGGALLWSRARAVPAAVAAVGRLVAVSCAAPVACAAAGAAVDGAAVVAPSVSRPLPVAVVRVRRGDASVNVAWRPPAFDGGALVASYRVVAWPGGATCEVVARGVGVQRCTVGHLANGARYRFTITADNGIGVSPPSAPSAAVVPSPFQPPVPSPFTAAVLRLVASSPDVLTATVYDVLTGQTWPINPSSAQHTASIVKVDILAALLYDEQVAHATMPPATRELATEMIEDSDNGAAQALYVQIGQLPGIAAFNALVGLTGTTPNWAWGYTDTTSLDQTRLVRLFALPNPVLDTASRAFGLSLMEHVDPAQAWGVSSGPAPSARVALKNGWYPTAPLDWQVNSIGWVDGDDRDYVLAVLTKDDATYGVGVSTIEALSTMVWQGLAPRAGVPRPTSR